MISRLSRHIRLRAGLLCGASVAVLIGLGASGALAQTAAAPPTTTSASDIKEIVVTAERRDETVQEAPQSITAISGAQLQAQGLDTLQDALGQVAGISIGQEGAGLSQIFLRGMSSYGGVAGTTGFYLDDVSLPGPAASNFGHTAIDPNLYDVKDVEVLRGPQGTLYGASSMGGTIRINTNQPNLSAFGGSVQVIGSGTDGGGANGGVSAMLNIPLVQDKLALRIVGTESYTSGWIDRIDLGPTNFPAVIPPNGEYSNGGFQGTRGNVRGVTPVSQDKDSNWVTIQGARATLLWVPTDNLTIAPMVMYQKVASGGSGAVDIPPGSQYEASYQPFNVAEPNSDSVEIFSLPIKYTVDDIKFESTTSYSQRNSRLRQDATENAVLSEDNGFYFTPPSTPLTYAQVGPLYAYESDHTTDITQQFRVSSTGDGAFQWIGGLYYEKYDSKTAITTSPISAYLSSFLGSAPNIPWYFIGFDTKITQYAAFGETSYKLNDFKLTAGLRYFDYSEPPQINVDYGALYGATSAAQAEVTPAGRASASGINPRVNLSYTPDPDLTLYVQAAKGFRPGVGLAPAPTNCGAIPTQVQPDTVWSYEGGEKAQLMDGRLTLNGDVYYENWQNFQTNIALGNCGYEYLGNAGDVGIYGSDVEATLNITPEIALSTSLGFANARYTSVNPDAESTTYLIEKGDEIQLVSKWTDTTSLVYTHQLNDDYNLVFRATDIYKSDMHYQGFPVPESNFVNLRLGLSSKRQMSAWLFVDNVANRSTFTGVLNNEFDIDAPYLQRGISPQPRTIGLELNYAFGAR